MNEKTSLANVRQNDAGRIEVHSRAIATVVAGAVVRCYGVVGMAPRNLRDSVAHVLRPEDQYKGIDVQVSSEAINIDLFVIIEYGTRIATVARNIMETVQYAVVHALGEANITVNVHVQGLRIEQADKEPTKDATEGQPSRWRRFGVMGGLRGQRTEESN
ncbi:MULTISPECIES: Asp23/Gls24 family envelope stress response protein [Herpetosiphon]|uniref:Asp23/Gls24 family envelope stress response protein n=1 Tax=Herpetosiphon TaxID=64 RepID=UPI001364BFAA|nr:MULTISPECIES: Asp23/Gls24 family envelope stress response protein [Herpetosiphon]